MFGSGILDTVIGLVFIFLLVSLLVTILNEMIAAVAYDGVAARHPQCGAEACARICCPAVQRVRRPFGAVCLGCVDRWHVIPSGHAIGSPMPLPTSWPAKAGHLRLHAAIKTWIPGFRRV